MSRYNGIRPVTNGLVFCVDPTNRQSYVSGSTLLNDLVGTTTGVTLFNGPTFSTGSTSNYITFDGTNDFFSTNYVHNQSDHTIITFVKLSTLNDDWIPIIEFFGVGGAYPWKAHYYVQGFTNTSYPNNTRGFGANFYDGTTSYDQWSSPVLYETNANEWMMLTGRVSGTTSGDTFINKIKSRPTTGCAYSNQPITMIQNYRGLGLNFYYGGNLGLVLYYNRALTDNEIIQTYNAYQKRFNLPGDIVTNGLILNFDTAYYNSYPRSGTTWSDLSGNGNNGTLTNGPTFVVTGASSSIQFDGVDDYVDCGNTVGNFGTSNFTLCAWIKTTSTSRSILSKQTQNSWNGFNFYINNLGKLQPTVDWSTSAQFGYIISNTSVNTGLWVNCVFVFNSTTKSNWKIYINGVSDSFTEEGSAITGTGINNSTPFTLAKREFNDGGNLLGNIANVQLYNRALTDNEILQNFNALRGRFGI
jgi:hypothetical protein